MTNRLLVLALILLAGTNLAIGQTVDDQIDARADASAIANKLGSKDPLERKGAAESLATLAAVSQKKVIEGYRHQEKDKQVRLALDWALYRIGRAESLFLIVRDLDSSRHEQAVSYLRQLDTPAALHSFLTRDDNQPKITAGLIEALATIGDNESLELIKPYRDSFAPGVAAAAENASDQIQQRLAQAGNPAPTRPRVVSTTEKPEP